MSNHIHLNKASMYIHMCLYIQCRQGPGMLLLLLLHAAEWLHEPCRSMPAQMTKRVSWRASQRRQLLPLQLSK